MKTRNLSRRDVLQGSLQASTALALGTVFASPAHAEFMQTAVEQDVGALALQLVEGRLRRNTVTTRSRH